MRLWISQLQFSSSHFLIHARVIALGVVLLGGSSASGGQARITVDTGGSEVAVPPTLHGIFFEDINYGADGGLYGELVQNRSFEHREPLYAWTQISRGGAQGRLTIESDMPLNANNRNFLRIHVTQSGEVGFGAVNGGFDGIPLREGERYLLSVFARRRAGEATPLRVSLETGDGQVVGLATFTNLTRSWEKYEAVFTSKASSANGRLVLLLTSPGAADIDMVSLFPEKTFKGRRNGLRTDLGQALADMKPGFLRFPGGCIVEGKDYANAYRWKDTIGDVSERKENWNLWQDGHSPEYSQTYGLGFFEYFQFCEDIGAEPVPVLNCGMTCQARQGRPVPLDELSPWVQDALDLVEFANGSTSTEWGRRRADLGHQEPFHLKYLAIGNEQWLQGYFDRYDIFYRALKEKDPELKLISSAGPFPNDRLWHFAWDKFHSGTPADVVDEHYYVPPRWFFENVERYGSYDRKGPKIFVGEFAGHDANRHNNLRSALSEAAYMTGLLRNAAVVEMASYAPLFGKINHAQWRPDLIWFDNSRVLLTPNYYAQMLFSRNRPQAVLPTRVEAPTNVADTHGMVGVGTWKTRAEFKDVRVVSATGATLFQSDFGKGRHEWQTVGGDWQTIDGALRQSDGGENIRAVTGNASWHDYTLSLRARKLSGEEGFLVLFSTPNVGSPVWWNLGGWSNTEHGFQGGGLPEERVKGSIEAGRWYDIRVELRGSTVKGYLDGVLVQSAEIKPVATLYAVAGRESSEGHFVLNVVNPFDDPLDTTVSFTGLKHLTTSGETSVLTSGSADDENSFESPDKVFPRTVTINITGPEFRHTFPANSLTILHLKSD
jgi:alpha-L-arabinofuranosidase